MLTVPEPEWRPDAFGQGAHALYIGGLYCGSIMHWRNPKPSHAATPWRAWFMDDDEGNCAGWFATGDEARNAVEKKLREALAARAPAPSAETT